MRVTRVITCPVFPARAGMIPDLGEYDPRRVGIPRESGDDPTNVDTGRPKVGYSPRERG